MKRLSLQHAPQQPVLYGDDKLRQDIREYVGDGGYIPFEHGYRPTMNIQAVEPDRIHLRFPIGRNRRRTIPLSEMDGQMLMNVILELFRYQNYCHLYA